MNSAAVSIAGPVAVRTELELRINIDASVAYEKCETRTKNLRYAWVGLW